MKILVTGGTGFLGKHVQNELDYTDHDVTYVTSKGKSDGKFARVDLTDPVQTWDLIGIEQPDVILHMGAVCGGILANKNSPADFLTKNLEMGINIFNAIKHVELFDCKIYTLGTVCAYPKFCPVPFKEDELWNGYPEETNAPYGHAKRTLLMLQNTFREQYGLKGAHLIPVNMFGEYDHFDLTNSHVIPALIRKFDTAIENGDSQVEIWGTGKATREFLYAGDCAKAIVSAINNELDTPDPINIGTGGDISIGELASKIGELCQFKGEIVYDTSKPDGQPKRMLDTSRAKEMLDFIADTDFDEALKRTIDWYRQNKDNIED